jgi:hypothetical protein
MSQFTDFEVKISANLVGTIILILIHNFENKCAKSLDEITPSINSFGCKRRRTSIFVL